MIHFRLIYVRCYDQGSLFGIDTHRVVNECDHESKLLLVKPTICKLTPSTFNKFTNFEKKKKSFQSFSYPFLGSPLIEISHKNKIDQYAQHTMKDG